MASDNLCQPESIFLEYGNKRFSKYFNNKKRQLKPYVSKVKDYGKPKIEANLTCAKWVGSYLFLSLVVVKQSNIDDFSISISLKDNNKCYLQKTCLCLSGQSSSLSTWVASIDFMQVLKKVPPDTLRSLKFLVICKSKNHRRRSCTTLSKNREKGVFASFVSGFLFNDNCVLIPDEERTGELVCRIIGRNADASKMEFARLKRRPFMNRLLLYSQSLGAAAAQDFARTLYENKLQTEIIEQNDGFFCTCTSMGGLSINLNIEGMDFAKSLTLLDVGKSVNEFFSAKEMEKRHNYLFEMMIEIDDLCKTNGIEYFLAYGSLLGAVRHHDFIPWDDDVDIFMSIDNYLKLRSLFDHGKAPKGRCLDDAISVPGYPGSFGRYVNCETTYCIPLASRGQGGCGSIGKVLDIFILFPTSSDPEKRKEELTDFLIYDELANHFHRSKGTRDVFFQHRYNVVTKTADENETEKYLSSYREHLFSSNNQDAEYYFTSTSSERLGEILKRSWFEQLEYVNIRGRNFPIPKNSIDVLQVLYGYGFRLFPKKRSFTPPPKDVYESDTQPFQDVMNDYLSFVDCAQVIKDRADFKNAQMQEMFLRQKSSPDYYQLKAQIILANIDARIIEEDIDIDSLVNNSDAAAVEGLLGEYIEFQLSEKCLYWPVYIPIDDRLLNCALQFLIAEKNKWCEARAILDIREEFGGVFPQYLEETSRFIDCIAEARKQFDMQEYSESLKISRGILSRIYNSDMEFVLQLSELKLGCSINHFDVMKHAFDCYHRSGVTKFLIVPAMSLLVDSLEKHRHDIISLCSVVLAEESDGMACLMAEEIINEVLTQ